MIFICLIKKNCCAVFVFHYLYSIVLLRIITIFKAEKLTGSFLKTKINARNAYVAKALFARCLAGI
jgi:hypothetical protein